MLHINIRYFPKRWTCISNRCKKYWIRFSAWCLQKVRLHAYHSCSKSYLNKTVLWVLWTSQTHHLMTMISTPCVQFRLNGSCLQNSSSCLSGEIRTLSGQTWVPSKIMFPVGHHLCWRSTYIKAASTHTWESCLSTDFAWCFYPRNICWDDFKLMIGESICRSCKMFELLV